MMWLTNPKNHIQYTPGWKDASLLDVTDDEYSVVVGNAQHLICNRVIKEDTYTFKVETRRRQEALGQCGTCRILTCEYSVNFKIEPKANGSSSITRVVSHL